MVACAGAALVAPAGALALSTRSATTKTQNSAGELVATAKCGANEHVVSGGFNSHNKGGNEGAAMVSQAVHGNRWTVHLYSSGPNKLTTYAYCAGNGQIPISTHKAKVNVTQVGSNFTAIAHCGSGEKLVSGGYRFLNPPSVQGNSATYADYATTTSAWAVTSAFKAIPAKLEAVAYCHSGPAVKERFTASGSIGTGGNGSATASCNQGETLLSGGYTTTGTPDWNNKTGPDFFFDASYRSGVRSWTASAHNFSAVAGKIIVFADCIG